MWMSPLGGTPGRFTASIFRLDPVAGVPIEPLADFIPGLTPLRVTLDMIDSESVSYDYDVTEHAVQSWLDVSSNIRKRLESLTITGTLGATPPPTIAPFIPGLGGGGATPFIPGVPFQPNMPPMPPELVRLDMLRLRNLKSIADARQPVMVTTPRVTLGRCAITSISPSWSPDLGESSTVSISFREIRLVDPLLGPVVPDFDEMIPGNNTETLGGASATNTGQATTAGQTGNAPEVRGVESGAMTSATVLP